MPDVRRPAASNDLAAILRQLGERISRLERHYDGRAEAAVETPLYFGEVDVEREYRLEVGGASNLKVTYIYPDGSEGGTTRLAQPTGHPPYPDLLLRQTIAAYSGAPDELGDMASSVAGLPDNH